MPEAHGAKPAPSSWHSNVLSSLEENTNVSRLTACSAPSPGPDAPSVAVGAMVSTTQVKHGGHAVELAAVARPHAERVRAVGQVRQLIGCRGCRSPLAPQAASTTVVESSSRT